jgi:ABC transporter substrate binding protein
MRAGRNETARFHHIDWNRGGDVAGRGHRAAEQQEMADRYHHRIQRQGNDTGLRRVSRAVYGSWATEVGSLIAASADVIVAQGTASLAATKRYTKTIPVVFNQVSDPVGQRLIDSLAHPGGNVTGLTNFEFASASKWIELLLELDRRISQVMLMPTKIPRNL